MPRFHARALVTFSLPGLLFLMGCITEDDTRTTHPRVDAEAFAQLSSGVGARMYSLLTPDGDAFASVLITGARARAPYAPDREYWRLDRSVDLAGLEAFHLLTVWGGFEPDRGVMQKVFEAPTRGWTAWQVERGFTLGGAVDVYLDDRAADRHLFSVYSPAPAGIGKADDVDTYIEYQVRFDLQGPEPAITWILAEPSLRTYDAALAYIAREDTRIVSKWAMRPDSREILFFGASKALRIDEGRGFTYSEM